ATGSGRPARCLGLTLGAGTGDFTAIHPHLDADATERGPGFIEPVVDVGAQRVQRNAAFPVELRAAHLGAPEASRALDPHAFGAAAHRRLQGLAHGAAELDTAGQLLGNALSD